MPANCLDESRILQETFVARFEHHAALASTNDRAAEAARDGAGGMPLLIVADRQTAGRGRGGNRWWTGPGSLAFTLLLAPEHLHVPSPNRRAPRFPGDGHCGDRRPRAAAAGAPRRSALAQRRDGGRHGTIVSRPEAGGDFDRDPGRWAAHRRRRREHEQLAGRRPAGVEKKCGHAAGLDRPDAQPLGDPRAPVAALGKKLCRDCRLAGADRGAGGRPLFAARPAAHDRARRRGDSGRCCGIAPDGALRLETPEGMRNLYSGVLRKER